MRRTSGLAVQLRPGPRLSLPVLVLHDHQRAGPQDRATARRRRRAGRAHQLRAGHHATSSSPTTISPATSEWEVLLRSPDRAARQGGLPQIGFTDPGRYACATRSELHRESRRSRRRRGVHRAGEHQPGQPDRRQEAAEQDHRVPRDAASAGSEHRRHHASPATSSGFPARHARSPSCATSRSSSSELPLDLLEFFFLTPLPGSEDHQKPGQARRLDGPGHEQADLNPPRGASFKMSDAEWRMPIIRPGRRFIRPIHPDDPAARRREPPGPAGTTAVDLIVVVQARRRAADSRASTAEGGILRHRFRHRPPTPGNASRKSADVPIRVMSAKQSSRPGTHRDPRRPDHHSRRGRGCARTAGLTPTSPSLRPRPTNSARRLISTSRQPARRRAGAQTTKR